MTILDANAVIAHFGAEPAAAAVVLLLDAGGYALTSVGLTEVFDHLLRVERADLQTAVSYLANLGLFDAIPVGPALGVAAGRLRARRYHRVTSALSLADCVAAECARSTGRPLATSDGVLLTVCHHEGIAVIPLPRSDGSIWSPPA